MKLTQDAKVWWKLWSVRLHAAGLLITGWLVASADAALFAWNALPADVKTFIPPQYMPYFGMALIVIGILSRFVVQKKLTKDVDDPYR